MGISGKDKNADVYIKGTKITSQHCVLEKGKGDEPTVTLTPKCKPNLLYVNGAETVKPRELVSGDTVVFGLNTIFRYFAAGKGLDTTLDESAYEDALYEIYSYRAPSVDMDKMVRETTSVRQSEAGVPE